MAPVLDQKHTGWLAGTPSDTHWFTKQHLFIYQSSVFTEFLRTSFTSLFCYLILTFSDKQFQILSEEGNRTKRQLGNVLSTVSFSRGWFNIKPNQSSIPYLSIWKTGSLGSCRSSGSPSGSYGFLKLLGVTWQHHGKCLKSCRWDKRLECPAHLVS